METIKITERPKSGGPQRRRRNRNRNRINNNKLSRVVNTENQLIDRALAQDFQRKLTLEKAASAKVRTQSRNRKVDTRAISSRKTKNLSVYGNERRQITVDEELPPFLSYVKCLLAPGYQMARVPDQFGNKTVTIRSKEVYSINITSFTSAEADNGRFSFVVEPVLGSTASLNYYKMSMVKTDVAWNSISNAFTDPNTYYHLLDGRDPRLDINYQALTQNANFFYQASGITNNTASLVFGDVLAANPLNYNITIPYTPAAPGSFSIGPGSYFVEVRVVGTVIVIKDSSVFHGWSGGATFVNVSAHTSTDATYATIQTLMTVTGYGSINFTLTSATSVTEGAIIITPSFANGISHTPDFGPTTEIRPVGMSALCTYINSDLTNAGMIAASCIPAHQCQSNFFTNTTRTTMGQLQYWESLAEIPNSYNGRLADGCYCFWTPQSGASDTEFFRPSLQIQHEYPCICVSGQYAPSTAFTNGTVANVLRIEVNTVWEIKTGTTLWEFDSVRGCSQIVDDSVDIVTSFPSASKNSLHIPFVTEILAGAGRFFRSAAGSLYRDREKIFLDTLGV